MDRLVCWFAGHRWRFLSDEDRRRQRVTTWRCNRCPAVVSRRGFLPPDPGGLSIATVLLYAALAAIAVAMVLAGLRS